MTILDRSQLDEHTRETLDLAKERILRGAHLTITVWDKAPSARHRVTVDLYYLNRSIGEMRRMRLTHAIITAGGLERAKPNSFHGERHMAIFTGGNTPVAANVVLAVERVLGLPFGSIVNWEEA